MEPPTPCDESGNYVSPTESRSCGHGVQQRPRSAPSRKILLPGTDQDRKSSSSPVIGQRNTVKISTSPEIENDCVHLGNVNLEKNNSQFKKVLPPKQDERKSNPENGSNKVFDTGKNYHHSPHGYLSSDHDIEPMPDIDLLKEDELPLPSLPFETVKEDSRKAEDEEGMEVEEETMIDQEEEQEISVHKEQLKQREPVTKFRPGFTVHGTKDALIDMVLQMVALPDEETGIFTKESLWFLCSEDRREVIRKKVLGRGSFGKVNLYVHDQTDYVIKQITGDFQRNEVLLTAKLNSPYIIQFYGMIVRNKIPEIIMEYGGQSMLQMARLRKFQDRDVWDLSYQGLCALEYLDEFGICHLDIKPENILLMMDENQFLLKLTDFGAAKKIGEKNDMVGWTVEYLSPERAWLVLLSKFPEQLSPTGLEESDITGKADIFALALTLMYAYERSHVLMKYITKGDNFYRDADKQPELQVNLLVELCSNLDLALSLMPKAVSTDMRFILNKMLQGDVTKRCTAAEGKNWMNFLSNLAVQQQAKGLKIQTDSRVTEEYTVETQTKPIRKAVQSNRKSTSAVGKPASAVGGTSQIPINEEQGWAKECRKATMETIANLPSGLKKRMVKRKLLHKLASGKKLKIDDLGKEAEDDESIISNGAASPETAIRETTPVVIVINDDTDEEKPAPVRGLCEAQEEKLGNGNIPNFEFLDMPC
ncbi:cAMP-dependent protein kinase catalytic subunit gamma [Mizuhopecten yessoensis]|uniref:cAMP-dependent protein kinase catalytic subunit gamma n=2 Tax=Mizuhopecten yessoensis TaxID=6573 RepID=A0A210PVI4_MIZYE|nr:cAMP-dependent protein kinase catalytic subunit gamma [Mizuhopecten yessoensis]